MSKHAPAIVGLFVRRYSDTGQVTAYVAWSDGSRAEGTVQCSINHRRPTTFHFGPHMHALAARARCEGVVLQRETW